MSITATEIIEEALDAIKPGEDGYDDAWIIKQLNKFALAIANHRNILLPALDTEATVTLPTSGNSVALPVNFCRNLYSCEDVTTKLPLSICNSKKAMIEDLGGSLTRYAGRPATCVAAIKPYLLFGPTPAVSQQVLIRYYATPATITSSSTLSFLPDGFETMPFHYVCWTAFERIEQGTEGNKADTMHHKNTYLGLLDDLEMSLKESVSLAPAPLVRMQW